MSIYTFDTDYVSQKLLPTSLRMPKMIAWLKVILKPLQTFWSFIFVDYAIGSTYDVYDVGSAYVKTDRVIYQDRKVYQCILDAAAGINCDNTTYWVKINDNFIGASERVLYNAQKIVFEYALNKWFFVDPMADQIYITNNIIAGSSMLMGETGDYSSPMATTGFYSTNAMGASYSSAPLYDYTIFVPVAVFNAQGSTDSNREKAIRNFADKYNLVGMIYEVVSY